MNSLLLFEMLAYSGSPLPRILGEIPDETPHYRRRLQHPGRIFSQYLWYMGFR